MASFKTYYEIMRVGELFKIVDKMTPPQFEKVKRYIFIGCGSSYNAGLIISEIMRKNGYYADAITAGEILVKNLSEEIAEKYDLAFLISRTGYTTETVKVAELLNGRIQTVGVTCDRKTPLANVCDLAYELDFAHEDSVIMTGSFSAVVRLFLNGIKRIDIDVGEVLKKFDEMTSDDIVRKRNHFVFLGYGVRYYIAKESALKVQELSLDYTEYHETLEYRHGPIALLSPNSHVVIFSEFKNPSPLEDDLAKDIMSRGASTQIITSFTADFDFDVQVLNLYSQLLGYKRAIHKGLNPDKPHGLTKFVSLKEV
uniref:SIS domain-containing protein n=1 Tax=Fervidobacterium pennivorans TaxID=93466 RepID=A0A7V4KDC0_FERPE